MDGPLTNLSPKARVILRAIAAVDGTANTRDLTERTGYANNTVGYHVNKLIDAGYAEHIGEVDVGAPFPANQYQLTDAGQEAIGSVDGLVERKNDLEERVQELEETVESLHQALLKLYERVDKIEYG